jgi:hypothetical protein
VLKEGQGVLQLTPRAGSVPGSPREKAEVQPGHGKGGIEVRRAVVVVRSPVSIARPLPAQRHEVVRSRVHLILREEICADLFRLRQVATVGQ